MLDEDLFKDGGRHIVLRRPPLALVARAAATRSSSIRSILQFWLADVWRSNNAKPFGKNWKKKIWNARRRQRQFSKDSGFVYWSEPFGNDLLLLRVPSAVVSCFVSLIGASRCFRENKVNEITFLVLLDGRRLFFFSPSKKRVFLNNTQKNVASVAVETLLLLGCCRCQEL